MNLGNIEAFLAIIEFRNISRAAEALYVTQSTISQRLKALEKELDAVLINRSRGLQEAELTTAGEAFIPIAEQWLALWKDTQQLKESDYSVSLCVASPDSLNIHLLLPLFRNLSCVKLPFHLRVRTQQSSEIFSLLNNREIDIGFVFRQMWYKNINIKPVIREKLLMICRSGGYGKPGPIHTNQLDRRKELFLDWGQEFQKWHDYWWDSTIKPHVHADTVSLILSFMDQPDHWAIVPISVAKAFEARENIESHEIIETPPDRICYCVTHRYPKESTAKSIEIFNHYLDDFIAKNAKDGYWR